MNSLRTDISYVFGKSSSPGKARTDTMVSISKGICIILMVIGHSGCPVFLHDFIYLFHMPFFFFISGWFCRQSSDAWGRDGLSVKILKRIKRLYLPFVLYCLAFILLSFISTACARIDYFGVKEVTLSSLVKVFVNMEPPTELLGATWFIRSLFFAAVIIDIALYLLRRLKYGKYLLLAIFLAVTVWMESFPAGTPVIRQLVLIFMGGTFFLSGYCFRDFFARLTGSFIALVVCMAILVIETVYVPNTVLKVNGALDSIIYILGAFPGILSVLTVSTLLDRMRPVRNVLSYVGNETLVILYLHFTAFIIINLVAVTLKDLDRSLITSFPVIQSLEGWWWVLYTVAGVCVPLLLKFCSTKFRLNRS